jgi:hypothetical protein
MDLRDIIQKEPEVIKEKVVKPKRLSIFDILAAASINKTDLNFDDDEVKKAYDQYMINRWLSMDEDLIFLAEMLTTSHQLTDKDHFNMIKAALPREKFYIKYMKRKKDLTEKEKRYIAHYFEIGLKEAEDYISQMEEEDITEILDTYVYGNNEMIQV